MPLPKTVVNAFDFARRQVDRVATPEFRRAVLNLTYALFAERPLAFTFVLFQAAFALMPLLCSLAFSVSIFFAFATGIMFLGLFWAGITLCILFPIFIVTSSIAFFTWGFFAVVVGLSRLAYRAFDSAFTITERDFRPRYPVDYPPLPNPAPPQLANPGGVVLHKAKRPSTARKDERPSDSEKESVPPSDAGSGVDAPER